MYVIDHFVPFPHSEYGGVWNVIAKDDNQCFDVIVSEDNEFNLGCYTKLRHNISKAEKFALHEDVPSKVVTQFVT